jgi:hypothetical protein
VPVNVQSAKSNVGAIVGGVIGGLLAAASVAGVVIYVLLGRKRPSAEASPVAESVQSGVDSVDLNVKNTPLPESECKSVRVKRAPNIKCLFFLDRQKSLSPISNKVDVGYGNTTLAQSLDASDAQKM